MIITVGRKPFEVSTTENVKRHHCGGINIDGTRIGKEERFNASAGADNRLFNSTLKVTGEVGRYCVGRFPANLILVDCPSVLSQFPKDSLGCKPHRIVGKGTYEGWGTITKKDEHFGYDDGEDTCASRYFFKVRK